MNMFEFPLGEYRDDGRRPVRPQLARVQAVVGAETEASQAWKKLTRFALVPMLHADSPERIFRRISKQPMDSGSRQGGALIPNLDGGPPARQSWFVTDRREPFSVDEAVLIAADARGIEQAEEAARTIAQRLQIFGQAAPRRIVWRVMSEAEPTWQTSARESILHDVQIFLTEAFHRAQQPIPSNPLTGRWVSDCELWNLAAARFYRFPAEVEDPYFTFADGPPRIPQSVIGKVIRELPNPFEPLEFLTHLGYRLDCLTSEEAVLLAPPR